jgi:hypothetical protein
MLGAGEFLVISGGGTYTVSEVEEWLQSAGWRLIDRLPLLPPESVLVAETA